MSTMFSTTITGEETTMSFGQGDQQPTHTRPARELRENTAAVRISFTWFGTRKSLSTHQKSQVADGFEADTKYISAGKKILNTAHPAFKAVTSVKNRINAYWKDNSLPFPESGIRLIRQDRIDNFQTSMTAFKLELAVAVRSLADQFEEMRNEARARLGTLFDPADYPESLNGLFSVEWDYPSVEPPDYLMMLKPALYEQERARVARQFDEAVQLAETAFTEQFADLISHLCDKLAADEDGKPKTFHASTVENLGAFFERFKTLSVRSSPQLDALVEQARQAVQGATPGRLRGNQFFRQSIAEKLSVVQASLDGMMIDKPRRRITRPAASPTVSPEA